MDRNNFPDRLGGIIDTNTSIRLLEDKLYMCAASFKFLRGNKAGCFFWFIYVILSNGLCILLISMAGGLPGNNQPADTRPIPLKRRLIIALLTINS